MTALKKIEDYDPHSGGMFAWLSCISRNCTKKAPRLVLLHRAYDTWPEGGINVSFVDCHTTRIEDEPTFKKHLEVTLSHTRTRD